MSLPLSYLATEAPVSYVNRVYRQILDIPQKLVLNDSEFPEFSPKYDTISMVKQKTISMVKQRTISMVKQKTIPMVKQKTISMVKPRTIPMVKQRTISKVKQRIINRPSPWP